MENGDITGNGDDVYELYNGSDVVDVYGVVGVDGTGEPWEYENDRVVRNVNVVTGSPDFMISEWTILEDAVTNDATPCVDENLAVPVELVYFTGEEQNGNAYLEWQTATETNNDYFEVQRFNGTDYEVIHTEPGNGSTTEANTYSFVDTNAGAGANYYKLVQYDTDGTANDNNDIVQVNIPVGDNVRIAATASQFDMILPVGGNGMFNVYNTQGIVVVRGEQDFVAGRQSVDLRTKLSKGVYIVEIVIDGQRFAEKVVIR